MTEDFVTFEIAKKLKEKGFPQHITEDAYIVDNYGEDECEIGELLPIQLVPDYMDDVAAPTIPQVLKWLREEKKIHVFARYCWLDSKWWWEMNQLDVHNFDYSDSEYLTHDDAILAGIEYAVDNLI